MAGVSPDLRLTMDHTACKGDGTWFQKSLFEVASHGFLAIANGAPGGSGQTTYQQQLESIKWITQNAGKGQYASVDPTRIAAAGQSCGGLETYDVALAEPKRVQHIGIFNSGEFTKSSKSTRVKQPIFYLLGGPSDMAQANVRLLLRGH
jgi:dienelactone hydrolase